jgi:surface antigen
MIKRMLTAVVTVVVSLSLSACVAPGQQGGMSNQTGGAITGGVLGGLLGSQVGHGDARVAAIMGGTLLGSYMGSRVGASMDETDRLRLASTLESTPTNQSSTWVNPDNKQHYTVVPVETYHNEGRVCRRFRSVVVIDGERTTAMGRACRDGRGAWQMVNG